MVSDQPAGAHFDGRLSERERQISYLVARGMKNRDIATDLKISENTVKRHLQSIFSKTGSRDRLELGGSRLERDQTRLHNRKIPQRDDCGCCR